MEACVSGARADSQLHRGFLVVVRSWWIGSDELKEVLYISDTEHPQLVGTGVPAVLLGVRTNQG